MNSSDNPMVANQLADADFPDNFEDFIEMFPREFSKIIDAVNSKEGALYLPEETATFVRQFDPDNVSETKNVYRKVIDFGRLPNTTSKRVQHNITLTNTSRVFNLYARSTDPSAIEFIVIYGHDVIRANETDIIITTTSDLSNFRETTVVFEYTK